MDKHVGVDGGDTISKLSGPGRWLSNGVDVITRLDKKTGRRKKPRSHDQTYEEFIAEAYAKEYGTGLISEEFKPSIIQNFSQDREQPMGPSARMYRFLTLIFILFSGLTVAGITLLINEAQTKQSVDANYIIILLAGLFGSIVSGGAWWMFWCRRKLYALNITNPAPLEDTMWSNVLGVPIKKEGRMKHLENPFKHYLGTFRRKKPLTKDRIRVIRPQYEVSGALRVGTGRGSGHSTITQTQEIVTSRESQNMIEEVQPIEETVAPQGDLQDYRIDIGPAQEPTMTATQAELPQKNASRSQTSPIGQGDEDTSDLWPKPLVIRKKAGIQPQELSKVGISGFELDPKEGKPNAKDQESEGRKKDAAPQRNAHGHLNHVKSDAEIESAYRSNYAPSDASYKGPATESVFTPLPLSNPKRPLPDLDSHDASALKINDETDQVKINHGKFSELASSIGSQKKLRSLVNALKAPGSNIDGKSVQSSLDVGCAGSTPKLLESTDSSLSKNHSSDSKKNRTQSELKSEAVKHFSRHFSTHPEDATRVRFEQLFQEYLTVLQNHDIHDEQSQKLADSTWDDIQCLVFESSPGPPPEEVRFSGVTLRGQLDLRKRTGPDSKVRQETMDPMEQQIHPLLRDELKRSEKAEVGCRPSQRVIMLDEPNETGLCDPNCHEFISPTLPQITSSEGNSHLSAIRDSSTVLESANEDVRSSSNHSSFPQISPLGSPYSKYFFKEKDIIDEDQLNACSLERDTTEDVPIKRASNDYKTTRLEGFITNEDQLGTPISRVKTGQNSGEEQRKSLEKRHMSQTQEQEIAEKLTAKPEASAPADAGLAIRAPSLSSLKLKVTDPRANARIYPPRNDSLPGSPTQVSTTQFLQPDTRGFLRSPTEHSFIANHRLSLYSIAESIKSSLRGWTARIVPESQSLETHGPPPKPASENDKVPHRSGEYYAVVSSEAPDDSNFAEYSHCYTLTANSLDELRQELRDFDTRVMSSCQMYDDPEILAEAPLEPTASLAPSVSTVPIAKSLPANTSVGRAKPSKFIANSDPSPAKRDLSSRSGSQSRSDTRSANEQHFTGPQGMDAVAVLDWAEDVTRKTATGKKSEDSSRENDHIEALPKLAGKGPRVRRGSKKREKIDKSIGSLRGLKKELGVRWNDWFKRRQD